MTQLDRDFVRKQFPAFSDISLSDTVFAENAGGSYMCRQVMERLEEYYRQCKVQPYYPNAVSMKAGNMMNEAYTSLSAWLNVEAENIYFGPSTSQNTYVLANAMMGWLKAGDEIIVTNQDHEANIGAWRRFEQLGIVVKEWQIDGETGALYIDKLKALISDKTRLLTFPHCSNILGEINPVSEICEIAKSHNIRTVVDGVSFAGHGLPDVPALGADIYLFSLYKVYGPHLGVMVITNDMAENLSNQGHFFNAEIREKRLMPAGPDHAQIAAVKGVCDYFEAIYQHYYKNEAATKSEKAQAVRDLLREGEKEPLNMLLDYIDKRDDLKLIGPVSNRAATVSVVPLNRSPIEVAENLGKQGVLCGAGHFYSVRLLEAMEIDSSEGVLRFSLVHYSTPEEVDRLIVALNNVL
ncbi:aminotransferase class V-fold PLP-dependent enzyme [Vibrio sp. HN007]|uniref:aminotransferase class V-fold PLP-dependent enzyme n=1 Tax=Vibrio iocasae TaxID=3098914 RepID=UPI0035D41465